MLRGKYCLPKHIIFPCNSSLQNGIQTKSMPWAHMFIITCIKIVTRRTFPPQLNSLYISFYLSFSIWVSYSTELSSLTSNSHWRSTQTTWGSKGGISRSKHVLFGSLQAHHKPHTTETTIVLTERLSKSRSPLFLHSYSSWLSKSDF